MHGSLADVADVAPARRKRERKVEIRKDEFGRDIVVDVASRKSERKYRDKKSKDAKKRKKSKRASRSPSEPRGRLVGTPPPADPFRPQVR